MRLAAAVLVAALGMSGAAHALVIWDQSPESVQRVDTFTGPWANVAAGQNFADQVLFASAMIVNGMDIYSTPPEFEVLGKSVTIRIRADKPDGDLLELFGKIDALDGIGTTSEKQRRFHATFDKPIDLLSDTTYWFGMSSSKDTPDFGQLSVKELVVKARLFQLDGQMAQYVGQEFRYFTADGDMLFRLEGAPVPEPGTLAFLGVGLAAIAFARRRKQH